MKKVIYKYCEESNSWGASGHFPIRILVTSKHFTQVDTYVVTDHATSSLPAKLRFLAYAGNVNVFYVIPMEKSSAFNYFSAFK